MPESTPDAAPRKTCNKCGVLKLWTAYYRNRRTCTKCVSAALVESRRSNPEVRERHNRALREHYQRNRERKIAAATEYSKANPPDPEQRRQWARERYARNPERHRDKVRAWMAANPETTAEVRRRSMSRRRARLRGLPAEPYTMVQIIERDGTNCVLCGGEIDLAVVYPDPQAPTVEHLECIAWPDSAGDVLSNVAVAHFGCNNKRRARPHPAAARKRAELLAAE